MFVIYFEVSSLFGGLVVSDSIPDNIIMTREKGSLKVLVNEQLVVGNVFPSKSLCCRSTLCHDIDYYCLRVALS